MEVTKHIGSVQSRWTGRPFPIRDPGVLLKLTGVVLALRIGAAGESWEREPGRHGLPLAGVGRYRNQLGHCPPHRSGGAAPGWRTAAGSLCGREWEMGGRSDQHPLPTSQTNNSVRRCSFPSFTPNCTLPLFFLKALQDLLLHLNPQSLCLHPEPYVSPMNLLCLLNTPHHP